MNVDTTQKLSFQPNCPSAKETFPWAVPAPYRQPTVPMAHDTTYHLSFMGGSGKREPLQMPRTDPNMIVAACVPFDGRTVYKESYLGTEGGCRPPPILPTSHLLMSCADQVKMDTNTMYGLAYEGHYNVCKQQPIRPVEQPMVGSGGPMQDLTTQKHDFVWKPCAKRQLIIPRGHAQRPTAALDTMTTANASYMPITQFSPSVSCRPQAQYIRPCGMLDITLSKLDFFSYIETHQSSQSSQSCSADGHGHHAEAQLPTCMCGSQGTIRVGAETGIPAADGAHVHGDGASAQLPGARPLRRLLRPVPTRANNVLLDSGTYLYRYIYISYIRV